MKKLLARLNADAREPGVGSKQYVLSFFIHGRGTPLQKTLLGLYRSLLHQLCCCVRHVCGDLFQAFRKRQKERGNVEGKWDWMRGEVRLAFISGLTEASKTNSFAILVDGLDEAGEDDAIQIVDDFRQILRQSGTSGGNLHISFACRHYPGIVLDGGATICIEQHNADDIKTFVRDKVKGVPKLDFEQQETLARHISSRSSGIFQWTVLVLGKARVLRTQGNNIQDIIARLNVVPADLHELYNLLLTDLDEPAQTLKLFQWLLFSEYPLSVRQIQHALALDPEMPEKSIADYKKAHKVTEDSMLEARVTSLSRGLVRFPRNWTFLSDSGRFSDSRISFKLSLDRISFIHQSVIDYLLSGGLEHLDTQGDEPMAKKAHFQISRSCLKYLSMKEIQDWDDNPRIRAKATLMIEVQKLKFEEMPFGYDFSQDWSTEEPQGRGAASCYSLSDLVPEDLSQPEPQFKKPAWKKWSFEDWLHSPPRKRTSRWIPSQRPFENAVDRGLKDSLRNEICTWYPLLSYAWSYWIGHALKVCGDRPMGNLDLLDFFAIPQGARLLDSWIKLSMLFDDQIQPQHIAWLAKEDSGYRQRAPGFSKVIWPWKGSKFTHLLSLLNFRAPMLQFIERNLEPVDPKDGVGQTPLSYAVRSQHASMVQDLLKASANVNQVDANHVSLLWVAINLADETIFNLLLSAGADVNFANINGLSPLAAVCEKGIIEELPKSWRNENPRLLRRETALRFASQLLRHGADPNMATHSGTAPLHTAAYTGQSSMVELLLNHGAHVDVCHRRRQTPLLRFAEKGSGDAFRRRLRVTPLPVAEKDYVGACDRCGRTPLLLAAEKGHMDIAGRLLEKGAQLTSSEPVSLAAENNHPEMVLMLLDAGCELPKEWKGVFEFLRYSWRKYKSAEQVLSWLKDLREKKRAVGAGVANIDMDDLVSEGIQYIKRGSKRQRIIE